MDGQIKLFKILFIVIDLISVLLNLLRLEIRLCCFEYSSAIYLPITWAFRSVLACSLVLIALFQFHLSHLIFISHGRLVVSVVYSLSCDWGSSIHGMWKLLGA